MQLSCVIIDDEPLALNLLESYIQKTPFLTLTGSYSSAVQAIKELPGKQVNLIFLDIQMPELNGIEFSRLVDNDTRIIFTTAFNQYAVEGYRVNALDYLLKPISYIDFIEASNKALKWFELINKKSETVQTEIHIQKEELINAIFIKSDYKLIQIKLSDILYIEGLKDYIKIYTVDNEKPILSLVSMKTMEELLPLNDFMRIHRSFIVRKDKIRVIDRGRIVFGKNYIPVSDSYKKEFQTFLDKNSPK